ncbi:G patch domain containing 3 [Elysia marginata]|uniref:G patch domain containing 3 n=1 Tax=Elysia marginata TaxID=1093978 RepID=A0AAV4J1G3_9GAST|nr:G patch domain containing 3 [Elysia marginata]
MPELNPPDKMPNGNVGTPTSVFLEMMRNCLLPQNFIKKLNLKFPKTEGRRIYSNVDFDYCTPDLYGSSSKSDAKRLTHNNFIDVNTPKPSKTKLSQLACPEEPDKLLQEHTSFASAKNYRLVSNVQSSTANSEGDCKPGTIPSNTPLSCSQTGRGEGAKSADLLSLNSPAAQDTEKMENCANVFKQPTEDAARKLSAQERKHFDEQTTDDLDVDFSVYEEAGAGDKDIKDFLKMRQSERFRSGYDNTDRFSIGIAKHLKPPKSDDLVSSKGKKLENPGHSYNLHQTKIGDFEKFSKGVGRRVMERQGWQEGQGLGRSQPGIVTALTAQGQAPRNKSGVGYKKPSNPAGHPIGLASMLKRRREPHLISTVYDDPRESDPKVPLLQREEPTALKHRQAHVGDRSAST